MVKVSCVKIAHFSNGSSIVGRREYIASIPLVTNYYISEED